jgi:hypothetical protein
MTHHDVSAGGLFNAGSQHLHNVLTVSAVTDRYRDSTSRLRRNLRIHRNFSSSSNSSFDPDLSLGDHRQCPIESSAITSHLFEDVSSEIK